MLSPGPITTPVRGHGKDGMCSPVPLPWDSLPVSIPRDCSPGSPIRYHPPCFEVFLLGSRDAQRSPRSPALSLGHEKLSVQL